MTVTEPTIADIENGSMPNNENIVHDETMTTDVENLDGVPREPTENNDKGRREVAGAAVAGGALGAVLLGPAAGLLAAGSAAVAATTKGKPGDVVRSGGETVSSAGDRILQINEDHGIIEKTSDGVTKGADWVSEKLNLKTKD